MTPNSAIFDIDGTLSDNEHRQHLLDASDTDKAVKGPNWQAFLAAAEHDAVKPGVVALLNATRRSRYRIVLITGRQEYQRAMTEAWLERHGIMFDELHMRPTGDHRPDTVIKFEIFERLTAAGYRFVYAVEDRKSVTQMWRERAGILCLQVCEGDY
ncbi:phosphatase domain-containing protein [Inquilinus sp. OTU3971]|uniref:phosphatase domain-containing protein n=1 Tax=Inquilinus sp. OTU3971 TaxID=3043855 RepID=UPI00313ABE1B